MPKIAKCQLDYKRCGFMCKKCPIPDNPIKVRIRIKHHPQRIYCDQYNKSWHYKKFCVPGHMGRPEDIEGKWTKHVCLKHDGGFKVERVLSWWQF
jgi:hypothetical protein